jgi:hypothetical protein
MRVNFHSHATNTCIFENPLSVEVSDAPEKLQHDLTELHGSVLQSSLKQETLVTFYASLPVSHFSELHKLEQNLASVFGSMYTCEQAFSHMK